MPAIHSEAEPGHCSGCGGKIVDKFYLLAVDRPWHVHCLRCSDCQLPLDSDVTCFAKDGYIFCREDYHRRFSSKRCGRCGLGISSNEFVMRARDLIFHVACFACASCGQLLSTGDRFGMRDIHIFCESHFDLAGPVAIHEGGDFLPNIPSIHQEGITVAQPLQTEQPFRKGQKGRPRKRKTQHSRPEDNLGLPSFGMGNENDMSGLESGDGYNTHPGRQKRMRTSFKHHQLRIMRSYFALNHNPDAKDLKQLAQKTGLSKRVLQVWFQNARAKYRRSVMKQEPNKSEADAGDSAEGECGSSASEFKVPGGVFSERPPAGNLSPPISDVSSSSSYSTLSQSGIMDMDQATAPPGASLSRLFGSTLNAIN